MLNEQELEAIRKWYSQPKILEHVREIISKEDMVLLEEYLHMTCLFPLSRHSELPDFMKKEDGTPLFPHNLNPKVALEAWQDAIEVGWEVVKAETGLSRDEVNKRIAREEQEDWKRFLESVERRKRERGLL